MPRSAHTVYLCILCGSQNKQRLFRYTALTDWIYNGEGKCLLRGTHWDLMQNRLRFVFKGLMDVYDGRSESSVLYHQEVRVWHVSYTVEHGYKVIKGIEYFVSL
jgi:hypothetical protein